MEIKEIAKEFSISEITEVSIIKGGHINQSFLVTNKKNGKFVLQKINTSIFKNPVDIIENLIKVNQHLKTTKYPYQIADLRLTINGDSYFTNDYGFWRATEYIKNSKAIQICTNNKTAVNTGKAYGDFVKFLNELKLNDIKTILPNFRKPELWFIELEKAININYKSRVENTHELISKARYFKTIIGEYNSVIKNHTKRILHNDTKVGNLLFNSDETTVNAVIDLDTVMPGYLINDFGDMVRSVCNSAVEDESDLTNVIFNLDYYNVLKDSYIDSLNGIITNEEISSFQIGIKTILYTQFLRFLSDYLSGDEYYQIEYSEQNLNRAKVQMELLEQIIKFC